MNVELLAPAGNITSAIAAFRNGADAIYLAGPSYGARAYAENFTLEEIKEIINYAHIMQKKVYVTINTLIYDDEIIEVLKFIDYLYKNDCDGLIVQDLGLGDIIKKQYPNISLHASTQMNIHTFSQAETLAKLGYKRVIMARETSIEVIKEIKEKLNIEVEVFVHGALCVCYSGNCYLSSLIGKRSGNRGRCAQPCRLPYKIDNDSEKYYLSPKDLCTIDYLNELVDIGVDSLKIEGRMKRAEYVAQVVSSYKKALSKKFDKNQEIEKLKLIFNRDFTKGFMLNEENNNFINVNSQNHQGIYIGKVIDENGSNIKIELERDLEFGDSIRIVGKVEDAITINQMYVKNNLVKKAQKGDVVSLRKHENNLLSSLVFLTTSKRQIDELKASYQKENNIIYLKGIVYIEDDKLVLEINDGKNKVKVISSENVIDSNNDFTYRFLEQLNKTSNTNYRFQNMEILFKNKMISIKEINNLRRLALKEMDEARQKHYDRKVNNYTFNDINIDYEKPHICVKVRSEEQLKVALEENIEEIFVESEALYNKYASRKIKYASPRINGDNSFPSLSTSIASIKNNTTSIYMNVVNSYSAYLLFSQGAKSVGLSLELSKKQIDNLINSFNNRYHTNGNFMVMVYGYYELMISRYCPLQKKYNSKKNCNICLQKTHYLVDRKGYKYPLIKGEGCYTKILNSRVLSLINNINELYGMGVNKFLLDFSLENTLETREIIRASQNVLEKHAYYQNKENVTFGHYNEGVM